MGGNFQYIGADGKSGKVVKTEAEIPPGKFTVREVRLGATWKGKPSEEDFQRLGAFKELTNLYVADVAVGDAAFSFLPEMKELRSVELYKVTVTDAFCDYLAEAKTLEELKVSFAPQFTGANLGKLAGSRIATLGLENSGINDAGLAVTAKLAVINFHLLGNAVTNAGVATLAPSRTLKHLDVARTEVTVDGLAALKACRTHSSLGFLDAAQLDFAAAAKRIAALLPRLTSVRLRFSASSALGAEHLRALKEFRNLNTLDLPAVKLAPDFAEGLKEWINSRTSTRLLAASVMTRSRAGSCSESSSPSA